MKEIFIWGISRCGNHALTEFIFGHYHKNFPPMHLKWTPRDFDSYLRTQKIFLNNYLSDRRYHIDRKWYGWPEPSHRIPFPKPKYGDVQIISYENGSCVEQSNYAYRPHTDICTDPSLMTTNTGRINAKQYALVILRDPYNWYASWKKGILDVDKEELTEERARNRIELWIRYAKTFFTTFPDGWFPVIYNRFCSDKNYRMMISEYIEEPFTDAGVNRISSMGSSFDRFKYDGKALKMQTDTRWEYLDDYDWLLLRSYEELDELAHTIGFETYR